MGHGKKKIEIKPIVEKSSRNVTFTKIRQGLFKKAHQLESMSGLKVAIAVFSPAGNPFFYGDTDSAIESLLRHQLLGPNLKPYGFQVKLGDGFHHLVGIQSRSNVKEPLIQATSGKGGVGSLIDVGDEIAFGTNEGTDFEFQISVKSAKN